MEEEITIFFSFAFSNSLSDSVPCIRTRARVGYIADKDNLLFFFILSHAFGWYTSVGSSECHCSSSLLA